MAREREIELAQLARRSEFRLFAVDKLTQLAPLTGSTVSVPPCARTLVRNPVNGLTSQAPRLETTSA